MVTASPSEKEIPLKIKLRGGNWEAFHATEPEILLEGPARTGKTYALLLRLVKHAQDVPGYRGLIVRKVAADLGKSILRTLEEDVFHQWEGANRRSSLDHVHFFGGSRNEPEAYEFENGSRIVVGGMDNPNKVLGSEYDEIYANEVVQLTIEDIETLLSRLSHGLLEYSCFISDCNPTYERHFVLQRALSGQMRRIKTFLKDNPAFYEDSGEPTDRGRAYLQSISGLTGTRYQRLVLGEWVGMENAIYPQLDGSQLQELPERTAWKGVGATGVDFGRVHLSAVVTLTQATDGVYWVRECWAEPGGNLQAIEETCRAHRLRFSLPSGAGCVDPIQEVLGQRLGFRVAKSAAGSRKARIEMTTKLLDAGALKFDLYGEGVRELYDEMIMYRYEVRETDTLIQDVVVRKDDDRVAALEYAVEGIELGLAGPGRVLSYA